MSSAGCRPKVSMNTKGVLADLASAVIRKQGLLGVFPQKKLVSGPKTAITIDQFGQELGITHF